MASDLDRFLVRLRRLEGQLERIANDFFFTSSFTDCPQGTLWQPPTDVFETETGVVVRMEVPGLDPRDIVLVLSGNTLRIRATRQDTHQHTKTRCHQFEVRFGRFERVILLPDELHLEGAEATYVNGFVVVTIPKADHATQRAKTVRLRL